MWWELAIRSVLAWAAALPGVRQLVEARWRTQNTTQQAHKAADRAERLIDEYRQQDRLRW